MDPERVSVVYDIKRHLRKGHSEDVFKQFMTLGGYSALAALLIFVLHLAMARILGPESYAAYGTYVAIIFTTLFCLTSMHLIITRFVSYHKSRYQYEQINFIVTNGLRILFIGGIITFIITLLAASHISSFFNLHTITPTVVLGFVLWFTMLVPVYEGAFKGLEDFKSLGRFRMIEAFFRLVLAVMLVLIGFGVTGALFGIGLGTFIALTISYRHLYRIQKLKRVKPNMKEIRRFAVPMLLSMISIGLLLNLDIILAKHFFTAIDAGVFAAASLLAKVPFLISLVFIGVIFPKVTQLHADGKNSSTVLKHALQIVSPIVLVFTLASFFFAQTIFNLLFGGAYNIGAGLGFYVFGMGCLAITALLVTYMLAIKKDRIAFMLPLAVIVLAALLILFHATIMEVMVVVMLVMAVVLAVTLYNARNLIEFDYFL